MAEAAFRVTTYELQNDLSAFNGLTYDLTLEQDLAADYFVMIYSAGAGNMSDTGVRGPDEDFARITQDPAGTGDLAASSGSDVIRLERAGNFDGWLGSVIVVESLGGAKDPNGFRLRAIKAINFPDLAVSADSSLTGSEIPDDFAQATAHWGHAGGGVECYATAGSGHPDGLSWLELIETGGSEAIKLHKDGGGGGDADCVCYLIEWGAAWTVTSLSGSGSNGGTDVDATGEWNTISIGATVTRASTFMFCGGNADDNSPGEGALGTVYALGDGITESSTETVVAYASEFSGKLRKVRMYVMEHPDAVVDYRSPVIGSADATGSQTVDAAEGTETYDNTDTEVQWTKGTRMALHWGTQQDTAPNRHPRGFLYSRHTSSTNADWLRSRHGSPGKSRLISVDLNNLERLVLRPDPAICTVSGPAVTVDIAAGLTLTPGPAVATVVAPATTVDLELILSPSPAVATVVGPAATVDLELILSPSSAVATVVGPAATVDLELILAPSSAVATVAGPAVVVDLELLLAPSPAVATASSPAVAVVVDIDLAVSPAVATVVAPATTVDLGGGPLTLSPTPAVATAALDVRGHPPAFLYSQTPAVATASSPAVGLSLKLTPSPAVCTAAAPTPQLELLLVPSPAVATAAAPVPQLVLLLPQTPAVATAVAPVLVAMADRLLQPAPAILTAAAPVLVVVTVDITLSPSPAVLQQLVPSPLLVLPGIEVVELNLAVCRSPMPALAIAMQTELSLQTTRVALHTLER